VAVGPPPDGTVVVGPPAGAAVVVVTGSAGRTVGRVVWTDADPDPQAASATEPTTTASAPDRVAARWRGEAGIRPGYGRRSPPPGPGGP